MRYVQSLLLDFMSPIICKDQNEISMEILLENTLSNPK